MKRNLVSVLLGSALFAVTLAGCSSDGKPSLNDKEAAAEVSAVINSGAVTAEKKVIADNTTVRNDGEFVYNPDVDYGSLWNSDIFNDKRFKLNIHLTNQEKKESKQLARSFEAHMNRGSVFMYHLFNELKKRNMPAELAALPMVESGFKTRAKSHAGARGPWQFIRQTGKSFGLEVSNNYDEFYDFVASTDASLKYLQHLHDELNNDWELAVAAYNQGEFGIKKAIRRAKAAGVTEINKDTIPMSAHAKMYVRRFRIYAEMMHHPEKFSVKRPEIDNHPAFRSVKVAGRVSSMRRAAELAGVSVDVLKKLNSGYLSDSLTSNRQRSLFVPVENAERLEKAIGIVSSKNGSMLAEIR